MSNYSKMKKSDLIDACAERTWSRAVCAGLTKRELIHALTNDAAPAGSHPEHEAAQQPVTEISSMEDAGFEPADLTRTEHADENGEVAGPDLTFVDAAPTARGSQPDAADAEPSAPKLRRNLSAVGVLMADLRQMRFQAGDVELKLDAGVGEKSVDSAAQWYLENTESHAGFAYTLTKKVNRGLIIVGSNNPQVLDAVVEEIAMAGFDFERTVSEEHEADCAVAILKLKVAEEAA